MSTTTWNGTTPRRADNVELAPLISEDWLSLIIGLFIFVLALAGIANVDLLGWVVTTSVWNDTGKALGTVSKSYSSFGGFNALIATYVALLVVLSAAAVALKSDIKKFALAFTDEHLQFRACLIKSAGLGVTGGKEAMRPTI